MAHYECNKCGLLPDACQCQVKEEKKRAQVNKRKVAQRQRDKSLDLQEVRIVLSATERANLDRLCSVRAGSDAEPYTRAEYLKVRIVADIRQLDQQLAELEQQGPCLKCKSPLPGGCDGLFKGESACFHHQSNKGLGL